MGWFNIIKKMVVWFSLKYHKVYYHHVENIPQGKGCLVCCNHRSNWDPIFIYGPIKQKMYFMAKEELFKNKIFGGYLKKIGAIPVKRASSDITAVKSCLRVLKEKKKPLMIFPTGTRNSSPEEVQDLKNGVALFAIKACVPIVPMVIVRKPVIFRPNRLVIGEEIDISMYYGQKPTKEMFEDINSRLTKAMEDMLEKYSYKKKSKKSKQKTENIEK